MLLKTILANYRLNSGKCARLIFQRNLLPKEVSVQMHEIAEGHLLIYEWKIFFKTVLQLTYIQRSCKIFKVYTGFWKPLFSKFYFRKPFYKLLININLLSVASNVLKENRIRDDENREPEPRTYELRTFRLHYHTYTTSILSQNH